MVPAIFIKSPIISETSSFISYHHMKNVKFSFSYERDVVISWINCAIYATSMSGYETITKPRYVSHVAKMFSPDSTS